MVIQPAVINVDNWQVDATWGGAYPEGARAKRLLVSPDAPAWEGIRPQWRYLFKRSDRRYPQQLWGEVIAYQIGLMVGIPVPPAHVAYSEATGQSAALIEWFYREGETSFTSAGSIFQRLIPDFDRDKGRQHNVRDAMDICRERVGDGWLAGFADMIFFDTLIGNSDRHQENWGFLDDNAARRDDGRLLRYAPWFDNGTSLGCERWPDRVAGWGDADLSKYVAKGCHHFRSDRYNDQRLAHLEYLRSVAIQDEMHDLLRARMARFDLDKLDAILEALGVLPLPEPLDVPRRNWIRRLVGFRAAQMKEILL